MVRRARIDAELVRRGMARSREHAAQLIADGNVKINGTVATKASTNVEPDAPVLITANEVDRWASRGAHKLIGALEKFMPQGLTLSGKRCLDAGASTGGFTDVLLSHDVDHVIAVDVGYGQLVWKLQTDDRVTVMDRTNVRGINADTIGGPVDLIVSDLSFISLNLVLDAMFACAAADAHVLPMVKPQFEVGRERVGSGGVVRSADLREEAVVKVAERAHVVGFEVMDAVASPLPGPSGNVEYFLWLHKPAVPQSTPLTEEQRSRIHQAIVEGPQ